MEPTTTTTPPAAAAAAGECPKAKRRRKSAAPPLGDVTNLLLPNTPTNPTTRRPRPLPSDTSASTCSISAAPPSGASSPTPVSKPSSSAAAAVHGDHILVKSASATPVSKPSSSAAAVHGDHSLVKSASASASVTPVSKLSSSDAVDEDHSLFKSVISTVYTRRSERRITGNHPTDDNVTLPAGTASCPPPGRVTRTSKKDIMTQDTRPISSSVPCRQAKKKQNTRMRNSSSVKPKLPEDFVKKQRTYFEEIDAFELPVEEASETDLE